MNTQKEQRDFRISSNTIFHLIQSQAGTIEKSLMELCMNSSDAKSDTFKLTIDTKGFIAEDGGIGFRSKDEIQNWFEELGFAHDSELHQEESRMSRFGLGRAQIMSFAPTIWRTNEFKMDVDIKERGLGYDLYPNDCHTQGCHVSGTWYTPLTFADLKEVLRGFEELVAYADISVEVNGRTINKKQKWDYETDQVMVKRKDAGDLYVYNKGYLIKTFPAHTYGSGIVVSKVPFILNIARNDILTNQCDSWKQVRAFLREEQAERTQKKARLTDDERQFMIDRFISGELDYSTNTNAPIIEDVSGRKSRFSRLVECTVTVHTSGNKLLADRIHQSKAAFVLSPRMIDMFGVNNAEELIDLLNKIIYRDKAHWTNNQLNFVPIEALIDDENPNFVRFNDKELTKTELLVLKALRVGMGHLETAVWNSTDTPCNSLSRLRRKLFVGDSQKTAQGWTDGRTYIALDRDLIKRHARDGWRGFTGMVNIIVHELCHDSNTSTGHEHNEAFYEAFHNVLCERYSYSYGTALRQIMSHYLGTAQKAGLKLSRNEQRDVDREVNLEREVYESEEFISMIHSSLNEE